LALLEHLRVDCELIEAPFGQVPERLRRWSPSGRVPLLVQGEVVIGESRVMLEHLAEAYAFDSAYPRELVERTLHRHAMAVMDAFIAPRLAPGEEPLEASRLAECVGVLEGVALASPPSPSLLAFHLAPPWLRFKWIYPEGDVTRAIRERPKLADWLDAAARLAAVDRTGPSAADIAEIRAACAIAMA
jgi:glutathione S-transferase